MRYLRTRAFLAASTLRPLAGAVICGAAALAAGCVTYERELPRGAVQEDFQKVEEGQLSTSEKREAVLVERTEEHPEEPKVWADLGLFYEESGMYRQAAGAYERMHALMEAQSALTGRRYTGGHYQLGRVYALLQRWPDAVTHLEAVLALKPAEVSVASLNSHFREAHYLLGVIYYEHRQWDQAQEHLQAFKGLGGDPLRVDHLLMNIAYEKKTK